MAIRIEVDGDDVKSLSALPDKIIDSVQSKYDRSLTILPLATKAQIVKELDAMGFLHLRNAVNILSRRLDISRVCIYNWINGVRRGRQIK